MSVRLEVGVQIAAPPLTVWEVLTDWAGQAEWIPLTTVAVAEGPTTGLGVRAEALSGFWLGRLPLGLLDRFVVTGWAPPVFGTGELEVLHLGPYFTGEGVFALDPVDGGTRVRCTEMITVPGGRAAEAAVRLLLPAMRLGFRQSLRDFARIAESRHRDERPAGT
ncbi:MAG: hypothetical protein JWP61_1639 [Friedmanniella sp.]|nr:hypothetical protein [Friedmanniella sp.]